MDVGDWLRRLGLGQHEAPFRENEIDAEVLPELTDGDLEKIGGPLGHRKRLLEATANLGGQRLRRSQRSPRLRHRHKRSPSAVRSRSCFATSSARRVSRRGSIPRTGAIWWGDASVKPCRTGDCPHDRKTSRSRYANSRGDGRLGRAEHSRAASAVRSLRQR